MGMIVVTGGSGFIGTHLCSLLSDEGHKIRIIDIAPPPLGGKAEFVRASVLDPIRLQKLFSGAEAVIHLAALIDVSASVTDPFPDFSVNLEGTMNVLEAARRAKVDKVKFASSAAVYGNTKDVPVSEDCTVQPLSPYGLSKLSAERYVLLYNSLYGMENHALRLFNVYGKGQQPHNPYSGVITKFAQAIATDAQPVIYGDGEQTRDFVHADDVANAFSLSLKSRGCDSPINVASGREIKILDLLEKMCSLSGKTPNPKFLSARKGEIARSCADISLARSMLGYKPCVSMENGLKEILKQG